MTAQEFRPRALCLDIETSASDALELRKLAAWRPDSGRQVLFKGRSDPDRLVADLDALTEGAAFVLGHNIRRHDLPVLAKLLPALRLHALGVVDTLELSPIAFPQNPYHSLVKDYRLVRDARSDPLKDAQLALRWSKRGSRWHAHNINSMPWTPPTDSSPRRSSDAGTSAWPSFRSVRRRSMRWTSRQARA